MPAQLNNADALRAIGKVGGQDPLKEKRAGAELIVEIVRAMQSLSQTHLETLLKAVQDTHAKQMAAVEEQTSMLAMSLSDKKPGNWTVRVTERDEDGNIQTMKLERVRGN